MTPNQISELLGREPFLPLKLHLNSGEMVEIADPGCAWIQGTILQIFTVKPGRSHIIENNRYIPLRNIAQVEQTTAA